MNIIKIFGNIKKHLTEKEASKYELKKKKYEDKILLLENTIKLKDQEIILLKKQNEDLLKRIEKLELNQKTYVEMIFKSKTQKKQVSKHPRGGVPGHSSNCNQEFTNNHENEIPYARFGKNLMSLIMYLRYESKLTLPLIASILKVFGGISITESGIDNQLKISSKLLEKSYKDILTKIRGAPVKHADETSWSVGGDLYWGWLLSTTKESYLQIEPTRGKGVPDTLLGSSNPSSVLVRDGYAGYDCVEAKTQYCWAHILRYARDFAKLDNSSEDIKKLSKYLDRLYKYASNRKGQKAYQYLLERLLSLSTKKTGCEAVRRVQTRLRKQAEGLLTALIVPNVPLTNNQAERDLRSLVISRKISYGSMSEKGAQATSINYSIMQTIKKRKLDILPSLVRLFSGESIYDLQDNG